MPKFVPNLTIGSFVKGKVTKDIPETDQIRALVAKGTLRRVTGFDDVVVDKTVEPAKQVSNTPVEVKK